MDECRKAFEEALLADDKMADVRKGHGNCWLDPRLEDVFYGFKLGLERARTEAKVSGEVVGWFCQAGLIHTKELANALKQGGYDVQPVYIHPAPQSPVESKDELVEILLHSLNMPDAGRKWAEIALDRIYSVMANRARVGLGLRHPMDGGDGHILVETQSPVVPGVELDAVEADLKNILEFLDLNFDGATRHENLNAIKKCASRAKENLAHLLANARESRGIEWSVERYEEVYSIINGKLSKEDKMKALVKALATVGKEG